MKVYLSDIYFENISSEEILNCIISDKIEGGYIIDINGEKIFAKSELSFMPKDTIQVKVVENSPSQLILKVLPKIEKRNVETKSPVAKSPEQKLAMTVLSKLNLPMKTERINTLSNIFKSLYENEPDTQKTPGGLLPQEAEFLLEEFTEKVLDFFIQEIYQEILDFDESPQEPIKFPEKNNSPENIPKDAPESQDPKNTIITDNEKNPIETKDIVKQTLPKKKKSIYKPKDKNEITKNDTKDYSHNKTVLKDFIKYISENKLMEKPEKYRDIIKNLFLKEKEHNKQDSSFVKKLIATKALNVVYEKENMDIKFFLLPLPFYKPIYIKLSQHKPSKEGKDTSAILKLSLFISTYNLGKVLAELVYSKGKMTPSIIFEKENFLTAAINYVDHCNDPFLDSIKFYVKNIELEDFLINELRVNNFTSGVNVKI